MKKGLQVFLFVFGVIDIGISILHLVRGPAAIPGSIPVNPTMDSEDRFYATMFLAFGVALVWCAWDVERKRQVVDFLAGVFFMGGIARLFSWAAVGRPDSFFVAMTGLELVIPVAMVVAVRRISSRAQAG